MTSLLLPETYVSRYNIFKNLRESMCEMIRLKVKELAETQGLSQGLLARKANMDVKTLKRIYRDPTAEISSFTLDKLAKALNVDASELVESIPDESPFR
jgi:transcriptional regulator with XRE-family HTH domain